MNADETEVDPGSPASKPSRKKFPAWASPPIFMYLTMVAAFAVVGIFVVYYVIQITRQGK